MLRLLLLWVCLLASAVVAVAVALAGLAARWCDFSSRLGLVMSVAGALF